MRPRPAPARHRVTVLAVLCTVALTGCTSHDDTPSKASAGDPPVTSTPDPSPGATDGPTSSSSVPAPTPTVYAGLGDRLLATADVPGLAAGWKWQDGENGPAPTDAFSPCAKADLLSIGATEAVQRTYFPPVDTDDYAAEQVAEFPDARTAATAAKVLRSWHDRCPASAGKVGPLVAVAAPGATASWYLVSDVRTGASADDSQLVAVGIAARGLRVAVTLIRFVGRKTSYPAGQEPMVAMVRAAAARLG
ncbi:MAG: hypothetical protein ACJ72D_19535 [Marmoricola sp.]